MTKRTKRILQYIIILLLFSLLTNCWYYSFKGTIPSHINSIAIPNFKDNTSEFNLQEQVTEEIRLNFIRENVLSVKDKGDANSILYGEIASISDEPFVYQEEETGETVESYQITINIAIEWYDKIKDNSLIERNFTAKAEYNPSGGRAARNEAISNALDTITDDIINSILNIW